MMALRRITLGHAQWCGSLRGNEITLSGTCTFRRWSDTGRELSPGKSRRKFDVAAGSWIAIYGRELRETEAAIVESINGLVLSVKRETFSVADGEVRVVK